MQQRLENVAGTEPQEKPAEEHFPPVFSKHPRHILKASLHLLADVLNRYRFHKLQYLNGSPSPGEKGQILGGEF